MELSKHGKKSNNVEQEETKPEANEDKSGEEVITAEVNVETATNDEDLIV